MIPSAAIADPPLRYTARSALLFSWLAGAFAEDPV
eukprot:COSAG03_NODE_10997_length_617_cov_1.293436_1_plen_34_part_10